MGVDTYFAVWATPDDGRYGDSDSSSQNDDALEEGLTGIRGGGRTRKKANTEILTLRVRMTTLYQEGLTAFAWRLVGPQGHGIAI